VNDPKYGVKKSVVSDKRWYIKNESSGLVEWVIWWKKRVLCPISFLFCIVYQVEKKNWMSLREKKKKWNICIHTFYFN